MAYSIRLPVFEGPLDLLLHLIRSHKLDIWDIPIARVTEQYLEYLAVMERLDLDIGGEFLVMASTLMEIKSRLLLPRPAPIADEEETGDPRAELVARLLEYERFQDVARQLQDRAAEMDRSFQRGVVEQWEGAIPLVELRPADLVRALRRLVAEEAEAAGRGSPLRVRREALSIRQRMGEVLRRVREQPHPLAFGSLILRGGRRLSRREIVVTFLAVLELVRLGEITAWQDATGPEIYLRPLPEVPGGDDPGLASESGEARGGGAGSDRE